MQKILASVFIILAFSFSTCTPLLPTIVGNSFYFYISHLTLKNIIWNNFSLHTVCRKITGDSTPLTRSSIRVLSVAPWISLGSCSASSCCLSSLLVFYLSLTFMTLTCLKIRANNFLQYPSTYIGLMFPHVLLQVVCLRQGQHEVWCCVLVIAF